MNSSLNSALSIQIQNQLTFKDLFDIFRTLQIQFSMPFYCQAFNKHQALGRFEKSASYLKGSLTQQVSCLFNSSMLLHTLFGILHVSSNAHKSWFFFFFRVRCSEMQQKQSSLERQALLLFYGPILLSNVINEHINSTTI